MKRLFKKKPAADEDEPLVTHVPDDVPDALRDATAILEKLAACLPSHLGAAHGLSLIVEARKWVALHGADKP